MKAAIVKNAGQTPVWADIPAPLATPGLVRVSVSAAALSPLTRGRASGTHYSSANLFPFVAGVDGVGRLDDGRRVYFVLPEAPHGGMAEQTLVAPARCLPVPDGLDDVTAAAIANPGMSSWAALTERARLKAGETVLINGATGTSGRLAVQIARHLGAGMVLATGRDTEKLRMVGADVILPLLDDEAAMAARYAPIFSQGVDVVIDYLWGKSAEGLLAAAAREGRDAKPIRFIQVGSASGSDIRLPSAVLRSSAIELMGSGIGSVSMPRLLAAIKEVLQAAVPSRFTIPIETFAMSDVEAIWNKPEGRGRTVFTLP